MANNRLRFVEKLMDEFRKGMPDGLSIEYFKQVPVLFARIQELEHALVPFARAADRERKFKNELISIYLADCEIAADMLNPEKAYPFPPKEIYYPA